ncbi:MAG: hypothetical protein ACM3U1_11365 [Chloroflexota bacterium]
MVKKIAILLAVMLASYVANAAQADTMAYVTIKNVFLRTPYAVEFEVHLQRASDRWIKFANLSMCFDLNDSSITKNPSAYRVIRLDTTELPPLIVTGGGQLPAKGYDFKESIIQNKLYAAIVGPDEYDECVYVPKDTSLLLGKYVIENVNQQLIDENVVWKTPLSYYQAAAYKLSADSLYESYLLIFSGDDNVELFDGSQNMIAYRTDKAPKFDFILDDFVVQYAGQRKVEYYWRTRSEFNCAGFTVRRAFVPDSSRPDIVGPLEMVGTHKTGDAKFNQDFVGLGNTNVGHLYPTRTDTVEFRGGRYNYYLYYNPILKLGLGPDSLIAVRKVDIPNAVISKATAMPNPFSDRTKISYTLEDDVYLSAVVRDLRGGEVLKLKLGDSPLDHKIMKKGTYTATFDAPIHAAQGTYEAMFIAYPIDDPTVEISRAYVKLNYIKE